jgi:hypothetical protein
MAVQEQVAEAAGLAVWVETLHQILVVQVALVQLLQLLEFL